ncbi:MAG: NAD(+)/NADH kinase [Gammaproteobacteria bacterium]|nr:NAD(+)/NADH kinase [Gammaproteobacteria bacterium]MDH5800098.1 NAD(+)/NADH kinase [Gammaproteobacteria bacterium]
MLCFLHDNSSNPTNTRKYTDHLNLVEDVQNAEVIMVVGGDGSMLQAISLYQHLNIPFMGIHAGTRGYLMNNFENAEQFKQSLDKVTYEELWILEAIAESANRQTTIYGFNDIWISRSSGQTLRLQVTIDDVLQPSMIIGDGILFCTPQGSTGYNLALRGKAISPGVPVLQVTPISCMVNKAPLGSVILSETSIVSVSLGQLEKRPAAVYHDGRLVEMGPVEKITVKKSDRTVKLGFIERYSFKNKVPSWQFLT